MKNVRCWRETHRRTMRLADACGREASSAAAGRQEKHSTIEARLRVAAKSARGMSAVRACRHICAKNMHALDVSSYLAISTIDAMALRTNEFWSQRQQRQDEA